MLLYENILAYYSERSNAWCTTEGKAGKGFSPSSPNLSVHATAQHIRTVFTVSFVLAARAVCTSLSTQQPKHSKKTCLLFPIFKL